MNQREWREQALARCQSAVWALSEASQALIDARRASETAGDWSVYGRDLDKLVGRLWIIREALEPIRNSMRNDPSPNEPSGKTLDGAMRLVEDWKRDHPEAPDAIRVRGQLLDERERLDQWARATILGGTALESAWMLYGTPPPGVSERVHEMMKDEPKDIMSAGEVEADDPSE